MTAADTAHGLLSCSRSSLWSQFRSEIKACTLPPRGGGARVASAAATAFGSALYLARAFLPQVTLVFQQQAAFFVLCERFEQVSSGSTNWASLTPIPNFEEEVRRMLSAPYGAAPPCLFGWAAALLCELRMEKAVLSGAFPELDPELETLAASENSEDREMEQEKREVLEALLARDNPTVARLTARGRWALRGLLRGGHRAMTLLESSGWCKLEEVLEALPEGELGPVLDGYALARAQAFLGEAATVMPWGAAAGAGAGAFRLRVWATSTHPTLLLEPLSSWTNFAELDATLCVHGCPSIHLSGVACVEGGVVNEVLRLHLGTLQDSLGHFPLLPSVEKFRADLEGLLETVPDIHTADVLVCGEPAFVCALLHSKFNKTVVGYIGNPLGAYLAAEDQMKFYDVVASEPRRTSSEQASFQLVFMAPPIAAQGYWQTGVRLPVVRPVAQYAKATNHAPGSDDVLITKQVFTFWDFQCILNHALRTVSSASWSFRYMTHLEDRSWQAWASHRAAVVLPYDPQTLVFYELYSMAIPLLVPSKQLLPLFFARSYGQDGSVAVQRQGWTLTRSGAAWGRWHDEASFNELRWWAHLSDVAQLPHLLTWNSVAELVDLASLPRAHLASVSESMAEVTRENLERSANFWQAALSPAMLP